MSPLSQNNHPSESLTFDRSIAINVLESLYLKSALSSDDGHPQASNAVLCTETRTYHVRQVQSSNSVFIAQPSETSNTNDDLVSDVRIIALGQCASTLELQPSTQSGIEHFRERLPLYTGIDEEDAGTSTPQRHAQESKKIKSILLEDAPISGTEFESAWRTLCVFEWQNRAFLPTATSLVNVWKSIMSAVALRSINLEISFSLDSLMETADQDNHPYPLLKAVIFRLSKRNANIADNCTLTRQRPLTVKLKVQMLL